MKTHLLEYFPDDNDDFSKIRVLSLFDENVVAAAKLAVETHSQVIELLTDKTLQQEFLSQTFYLCEKGFSSTVALKTKYRICLLSLENN